VRNLFAMGIYLKQHLQLRWQISNDSNRRKEILELPEAALREAVINAVCHNDYLQQGAQVTIEIFDDRVEIYNPGGLPKGLRPEEFGTRSVCRNPLIASLLLRCSYIEKLGTGISRIRDALQAIDCPMVKPRFTDFFTLEFQRPSYQASEKTSEKTSEKILRLVSKKPQITIAELAKTIDITPRSIERNIDSLKRQGKLQRIGSDKGGRWQVNESE